VIPTSSILTALLLFIMYAPASIHAQSALSDKPFVVEYYYKVKWGHADEFLRLFKKNHYPLLKKEVEMGRMLKVWMDQPRYHTTEDGRWDYRVTIVFKNATWPTSHLMKTRSRNNYFLTRRNTKRKSSGGLRFWTRIGTCPSRPWIWKGNKKSGSDETTDQGFAGLIPVNQSSGPSPPASRATSTVAHA
jgi:hypothetical protein